MIRIITALCLVAAVSACGAVGGGGGGGLRGDTVEIDGVQFRGNADSSRESRQRFVASVGGASESLEGAVEAARLQGIRHCIEFFGTSDIAWDVGPDTPRDALIVENDTLTFVGTCVQ